MASVPLAALRRTVPVEAPGRLVVAGLEEVGAHRLREDGAVKKQRDIFAGLLAGPLPAGADLGAIFVAEMDAVVRRVLGVGRFGRKERKRGVEGERPDVAGIARLRAGELTDLWHMTVPSAA